MVHRNSAVEIRQDRAAIFVDRKQELPVGDEVQAVNVGAVGEGEGIRSITADISNCQVHSGSDILNKVKNRDLIAYRGEQAIPIGGEEEVSFAIDRPQEIGKLRSQQGVRRVFP